MTKLKKIDGGMYCFLLTFDPSTEVINIMDLPTNCVSSMPPQSKRSDCHAANEEEKPVADTIKQKTSKSTVSKNEEPLKQSAPEPEESKVSTTTVNVREQLSEQEEVPKPTREYRPHDLLTRREAAAYLGVSEQTLAIWKCTGRYNLPYLKVGRLVKYEVADLDAYLKRVKHSPLEIEETPKSFARSSLRSSAKIEF